MAFPSWVLGVILIILGSLGNNLGNNLVSLGHAETNDQKRKASCADDTELAKSTEPSREEVKKSCMSWRLLGTLIFVFGNLFTFASFGFGAQSLLASLESIQFVSNLVFAKYVHNETVTVRMMLATVSIVVGNVLVVIFAEHSAVLYHSTGMIHLYVVNSAYHGYLVCAFVLWAVTNYVYLTYHHSRVKLGKMLWKHNFLEPFCFAMSSAIVGTQAVLNSKCMSMLIQVSARGEKNEFESWYIWFILVTWIMMVAYWLHRLDKGLELFPPLFIIPVMQVFFVFFAILCGGIYFEEFTHFTASQFIGFIFGVSMILGGVYGLAPPGMKLTMPVDHVAPVESQISSKEPNQQGDIELAGSVNYYLPVDNGEAPALSAAAEKYALNNDEGLDKDAAGLAGWDPTMEALSSKAPTEKPQPTQQQQSSQLDDPAPLAVKTKPEAAEGKDEIPSPV